MPVPSHTCPPPHVGVITPAGRCVHWPTSPGSAHASQTPPQSLSQQRPARQCALAQSPSAAQTLPSGQPLGQLPPQSASVSSPSFLPSVHSTHLFLLHCPLLQSAP